MKGDGENYCKGKIRGGGVGKGRLREVGSWGGKKKVREGGGKGENDWGMYRKGEKGEDG